MTRLPWHHPARDVLASVRYAGIRWHVDARRLYLTGATDHLTEVHRARIAGHRSELMRILEALPARCVVPHMCCVIGPCDPAGWYSVTRHSGNRDVKPARLGVSCSAECLNAQMPRLFGVETDACDRWADDLERRS